MIGKFDKAYTSIHNEYQKDISKLKMRDDGHDTSEYRLRFKETEMR